MIGPDLLKRNLMILRLHDSGNHTRMGIVLVLNLASIDVVHWVIRNRRKYETDPRIPQMLHTEQLTKTHQNSHMTKGSQSV